MRIAYITYEYPPDISAGGIATYVYEAARMMVAAGWSVEVFAGSFTRSGKFEEDGIIVNRIVIKDVIDFREKVGDVFEVRNVFKPFDIYETPEINGNALHIAKRNPTIPFITKLQTPVTLQLKLFNYYKPFFNKVRFVLGALRRGRIDFGFWRRYDRNPNIDIDYIMTHEATAISSPSYAMKKWAVNYWRIPKNDITVLANLFSPPENLINQVYSSDRVLLTFVGKINVHKGMFMLMKALPAILEKCSWIDVCLIGNDGASPNGNESMRNFMECYLKKWSNRIIFTGAISKEEIHTYLNKSLVCIFPSIWEAFGYVSLEAMSAGVPVLVSKGSGMEEIIDNDKYGVSINPLSSKDIAYKTLKLINDKNMLQKLSTLGRDRVLNFYTGAAWQKRHIEFYMKTISKCV